MPFRKRRNQAASDGWTVVVRDSVRVYPCSVDLIDDNMLATIAAYCDQKGLLCLRLVNQRWHRIASKCYFKQVMIVNHAVDLAKRYPEWLKSVDCGFACPVADSSLVYFSQLHSLRLWYCPITDDGLQHLKNVRFLSIGDCRGIVGNGLSYLTNVRHLHLALLGVLDHHLALIPSTIKRLTLWRCNKITQTGIDNIGVTKVRVIACSLVPDSASTDSDPCWFTADLQ